jgi:ABC-2 type transport system ATP-binding protein
MIKFENLTKYYGHFCAVDHISFEVRKGEILGFLGPNGAGKTTTYRILTGYLQATSGSIKVKDYNIHEHQLEIKRLIGYLPESAPIYHDMLVYDYLNYIADIRGVAQDKKLPHIKELADLCSLNEVMHKAVNELSKGYRQRVGIAQALMGDPEILVLDEPTVGLDPNQIVETREIIKRIGKEKTIIFSTHILSEALATCNRIIIINNGKLAADHSEAEIRELTRDQSFEDLFRQITRGNHQ